MATSSDEQIPLPGQWPVDPQEDVPISEDRIWVDGCFDFSHHGKINSTLDLQLRDLTYMNQGTLEPCSKLVDSVMNYTWGFIPTKRSWRTRVQR